MTSTTNIKDLLRPHSNLLSPTEIDALFDKIIGISQTNPIFLTLLAPSAKEYFGNHMSKHFTEYHVQFHQLSAFIDLMTKVADESIRAMVDTVHLWKIIASEYALLPIGKDQWEHEHFVLIRIDGYLPGISPRAFRATIVGNETTPTATVLVDANILIPAEPPFDVVDRDPESFKSPNDHFRMSSETWRDAYFSYSIVKRKS